VGEAFFYMKVGTHGEETLEQIVDRKTREIARNGYTLWGYGGNTCHPTSIVQPFAQEFQRDGHLSLLMEPTHANHFAVTKTAAEYSEDGVVWEEIPPEIEVKGSRYALVIDELVHVDMELPLEATVVPIGPNTGRRGDHYVVGLVDKACLTVVEEQRIADQDHGGQHRQISLRARIRAPFAVFLRGYRD
jgi:hypothetical protein